jgi:hypothetical protein
MDWHAVLGISAGVVQIVSAIPYIRDIVYGTSRPNTVSFFIWFVLGIIEVFAQYSAGASWSIVIPIVLVLNTFIAFSLGVLGYGYKKYNWLDFVCLGLAAASLVIWYVTDNPVMALVVTMVASVCAAVPTIVKTYKEPHSENVLAWFMNVVGSVLAIFASTLWNVPNLIIPIIGLLEGAIISGLAFFRRPKKTLSRAKSRA